MSSLWLPLGLVAITLAAVWMAVSLAKASASARSELDDLEDELEAVRRFNEQMRNPRKRGKDLVDSLRRRAFSGVRNSDED